MLIQIFLLTFGEGRVCMRNNIIILGATSFIAKEAAKLFASHGSQFMLIGRDLDKLKIVRDDLLVRGALSVHIEAMDLTDKSLHKEILHKSVAALGTIDNAFIAYGSLPDQKECEGDYEKTLAEINVNYLSVISLLTMIGNYFAERKMGQISVITSVAGDRGRMSNYVYGSAKGGLAIFLQGLRNRLYHHGVNVLTIKPGFVSTPMTSHLNKNFLFADPSRIAHGIVEAMKHKKTEVYLPWFWKYIMFIIRFIPESIFKKLRL